MLSFMAMEYFQKSPVLLFPLLALGIFFTVFVAVSLRAMLTNQQRFEALSRLPLEDEKSVQKGPEEAHHV